MVECPECHKEIDFLYNICSVWKRFEMRIFKSGVYKGMAKYSKATKEWDGDESPSWNCPECDAELFYDEKEAIKFLEQRDKR